LPVTRVPAHGLARVGWWWCCWGKTCCFDSRARASPALRRRSPDRPAPPGSAMLRPVLPLAGHARAGLRFAGDSLRSGPLGEAAGRRAWPAPIPGSRSACFAPPFARRGRARLRIREPPLSQRSASRSGWKKNRGRGAGRAHGLRWIPRVWNNYSIPRVWNSSGIYIQRH
jgi:hypothetical protein